MTVGQMKAIAISPSLLSVWINMNTYSVLEISNCPLAQHRLNLLRAS